MKTILVVDNHPVVLKLLVEFLKKQGHEVITAEDGLAALEILKKVRPDIVFTDLIMPNISGEKLCQVIRNRPELKNLHIIVYSATVLEDATNILNLGADACIAKGPFKNTETHIAKVIEHIDRNTLHELKGKILGGEDLYKRHITSELLFSKRHYESIFNSMPEGVMEFTLDGKIFRANTAALALCGLREEDLLASSFPELFTGDHRERLHDLLHTLGHAPVVIGETEPILLNGKMVTIDFLPSRDESHAFIIAILRDLTEKIATTRELEMMRRQQERILNAVGEGIFGLDTKKRITFANPAALALLDYEPHELVGARLREIVHACTPENNCPICSVCQDGFMRKGTETFWRKNGTSFPVRYTSNPIVEDYKILGAVVAFADITERQKMEEKLRESAMTDELTFLFNRRGFMTLADKLIKISVRDKTDLLLIFVDFDNLKWINDSLGHSVGDQALIEAATLLRDTFRLADVVARLGGDEFVILCTDNSALGNEETILNRLRENIDKTNRLTTRQYRLSLSVGVGRYEHQAPCSIDELLRRADQAMYHNKEDKKARRQDGYKQ
ncbi:MAG: diguanylate cyclase [Proteobacteria bacterium]|jgi:diguanylate cyclase (GGDEF)-like protein/PAS domain S-box-containing protein|nr:diguanylate cyclase [Pseudomonadota bacterium]MBU4408121.1 diguanylate cyclase [Pseudomonadota bacterium]MBU4412590.1 diguanylate cyclase [Pseudomonadota bacterium]MCG2823821.1 diguanylate cyclase [Desulfobulbaceae bacterium]MDP2004002.1 diguanylate cyclase [Desulfurivibrionaceae bacterium]